MCDVPAGGGTVSETRSFSLNEFPVMIVIGSARALDLYDAAMTKSLGNAAHRALGTGR